MRGACLVACAALAGCGLMRHRDGGGALYITASTPGLMWRFAPVELYADEVVDADSLEAGLTLTVDGAVVARAVEIGEDGRTITVRPAELPPAPFELAIAIEGALSADGEPFEPTAWSGSVPAWVAAGELTAVSGLSEQPPRVTTGGDGHPVVSYVAAPDSAGIARIEVVHQQAGSWIPDIVFSPQIYSERTSHALAVDGEGRVVAAWSDELGSYPDYYYYNVNAARWDAPTLFLEDFPVLVDRALRVFDFDLVVDGGRIIGTYVALSAVGGPIVARACLFSDDQDLWAPCWPILQGTLMDSARFAFTAGAPVAAYEEWDNGEPGFDLRVARLEGDAWVPLAGDLATDVDVELGGVVATGDTLWVSWRDPLAAGVVGVARVDLAGGAMTAAPIALEPDAQAIGPIRLALDSEGRLYAAWPERSPAGDRAVVVRRDGGEWTRLAEVADPDAGMPAETLDLAIDGWDLPVVVFGGGPAAAPLRVARYNGDATAPGRAR